jgi:hypothetical protein
MALQESVDILEKSFAATASHVSISFAREIGYDSFYYLVGQACRSGGLEQRKFIEFVVFIVDNRETVCVRMSLEPSEYLVPARALGHVRQHVDIRDPPVFCAK